MFSLYVDEVAWQAHQESVLALHPGLVPVAKGNGYGFGVGELAVRAEKLGCDTLAVGTYREVAPANFPGSTLVLTPWRPGVPVAYGRNVIHTLSRADDVDGLLEADPAARFVVERMTSMRRHGMGARELRSATASLTERGIGSWEGVAIHLPLGHGSQVSEVNRLLNDVVAAEVPTRTIFVSHLSDAEMATISAQWPDFTFRPRVGTRLWLGAPASLSVKATVLDSHPIERGEIFGYRGRSAPKQGTIVVVSGGTAHGVGLEAPHANSSLKERAATVARGGLDAAGFVRSPFTIDGKQRLFAEPPHMQASMLFLPAGARVPAVGEEVAVRVRFTASTFDQVVFSEPSQA